MELNSIKQVYKTKIIKRYQNRKLYDTQQSCYVTLEDIAKMIRQNEEVVVIDNKSKNDITASTLTQIIFESEKKASQYAPLFTLREIIQNGNGSISSYLAKLGAFPFEQLSKPMQTKVHVERLSSDDVTQNVIGLNLSFEKEQDYTSKSVAQKANTVENSDGSDLLLPGAKLQI